MRALVCAALIALGCASSGEPSIADASIDADAAAPDPPLPPFPIEPAFKLDSAGVLDTPAGYEVGSCPAPVAPAVGFEGAPELPFTGEVTSVAADLLVIGVPGRAPVTLHWAGASLVGVFGVRQTVTVSRMPAQPWVEIDSPSARAAIHVGRGAGAFEATPALPGGLALSFFVGCTPASDQLVYTLGVKLGIDDIIIPPGATAGAGFWTITNVSSSSSRGAAGDPGWVSIITALGRKVL